MPQQTIQQNISALSGLNQYVLNNQSILDVFVLQDILEIEDANKLKTSFKTNREVENFLIKNRLVTQDTINKAYSILLKLPYIGLSNVLVPDQALKIIPEALAKKYGIIPFDLEEGRLLKLAISAPSDLLANYPTALNKILIASGLMIELFITGLTDFKQAVAQYNKNANKELLLKQGSLPIISLRNLTIKDEFLKKIPREYVEKYRLVIFDQNLLGRYQIACEQPDTVITKKVLEYLEKENGIKLETYATSAEDLDYVIAHYGEKEEPSGQMSPRDSVETSRQGGESLAGSPPGGADESKTKKQDKGFLDNLFKNDNKKSDLITASLSEKPNQLKPADEKYTLPKQSGELLELRQPNQKDNLEVDNRYKMDEKQPDVAISDEEANIANLGLLLKKDVKTIADLEEVIKQYQIPKIVAGIINFALNNRASDVHIEPQAKVLRIRCRLDGILTDITKLPLRLHPPIISRIKILSAMKIDEARIPQDGRFEVTMLGRVADIRVSTLPTVHGEKIVLRILDKSQRILSLEDLGMQGMAFDITMEAITKPWGIILATGPTGSGKSTTLTAIINRLNVPGVNIITLEDPIEYETPGVNQCQVKPDIGFSFASGLRSVLRQDPNIIMVGEIRDGETAGMATHAALTGHLVLSTLHTNDTSGTLPRLINMGVEPFLITSSLNLIIAQRLIRQICLKCKEEVKLPDKLVENIRFELDKIPESNVKDRARIPAELKFYYGAGCSECKHGYLGRIGIFEVMKMSPQIEDLAISKRPATDIKATAIEAGMITIKQDGILKALAGLTTIDEVLQATQDK